MILLAYLLIFTVALEGKSVPKEKGGCGDRRSGVFCAVLYHSIIVAADPGLPCTPSCSCSRISAQAQKPIDEPITNRPMKLGGARATLGLGTRLATELRWL